MGVVVEKGSLIMVGELRCERADRVECCKRAD